MRISCGLVFAVLQTAARTSQLVIHEHRSEPLSDAIDRQRIEPETWLPMRISLRQNEDALNNAEHWILDVSDPESPNFGRHWSQGDIIKAFQPLDETVSAVKNWLTDNNITHFTHTDNKQWLAFELPASQAEKLLHTEYFEHKNLKTGRFHASTDQYSLPQNIQEHVDFIMPAVVAKDITGRSARSRQHFKHLSERHRARDATTTSPILKTSTGTHSAPSSSSSSSPGLATCPPNDLKCCDKVVSPACVRQLYNIPATNPQEKVSPNNSMGVFEQYSLTLQSDLNDFFHLYTDIPNGTAPIYKAIDGAITNINQIQSFKNKYIKPYGMYYLLGEATLDVEAAFPIVYPQNLTVFQEDDPYWAHLDDNRIDRGLFNSFFDAVDGSDCTFSAYNITGADPKLDPIYPDHHDFPEPWTKKIQCGVFNPTKVISFSYANYEMDIPFNYQKRQCLEFGKLALQGVSMFVSSGDAGVGPCTNATSVLNVNEPEGCPWLTVVGATQILYRHSIHQPESAASFSGGGFSNVFPRAKYQEQAVTEYFKNHDPGIPYYINGNFHNSTGRYNRNGRGYPDIAANGMNVATITNGRYEAGIGTSASAPIAAAIFNRINEERIRAGKGPVGFVNPTLYKNPQALNDIVSGNNKFQPCHTGFTCVPGWEPVNGLGTPNYAKLLDIFLKLP